MIEIHTIQIDKPSLGNIIKNTKTLLSTIEYDRNALLLTIVNLVFKMYRNGMLSAETEVRNGIVAAVVM